MAPLGDLLVEARQQRLQLALPRVDEHALEDLDPGAHVVQDVHAGRGVVEAVAAHRVLDEGLELPQREAVGQVRVRAQQRTGRGRVDGPRLDQVVPLGEHVEIPLGEDDGAGVGGGEAEGAPELVDADDRRARPLGDVVRRVQQGPPQEPRHVAGGGQLVRKR